MPASSSSTDARPTYLDALARQALATALSCWVAAVAAFVLQLTDPWWAAISAWVIAQSDRDALLAKSLLRIIGTIAGAFVGYQLALLVEGLPLHEALAFAAIGGVSAWGRFTSRFSYAWLLGGVTATLILASALVSPASLETAAYYRTYEVILGILAATVVCGMLAPPPERLQELLADRLQVVTAPEPALAPPTAAVVAALTLALAPVAWSIFDVASLAQIAVSIIMVLDRDVFTLRMRGRQRLAGCMLGGAVGLLIAGLSITSFLVWSVALVLALFAMATVHHGARPYSYVGTQGGFALLLALVTGPGPPDTIEPVLDRLAGMLAGVGLMMVVSFLLEPLWRPRRPTAD